MDRWEFEQICIDSRLRPVFRHDTPNAVVLVADGWFDWHQDRPYPHHRTVWAIGKGESELQLGRSIYTEGGDSTLQNRISAACEDALVSIHGMEKAQKILEEHRNPEAVYNG